MTSNKEKYIEITGLSEDSNIVFNNAIKITKQDNCAEMLGIHLLMALLDNRDASKFFYDATSVESEVIRNEYEFRLSHENTTSISKNSTLLSDVIYISDEITHILNESTKYFKANKEEVHPELLLLLALEEDDTSIFRLLDSIGLDKSDIYETIVDMYYNDKSNNKATQNSQDNDFSGMIPLLEVIPITGSISGVFPRMMTQSNSQQTNEEEDTDKENGLPYGLTDVMNIIDSDSYDGIIGRQEEINSLIEILSKRKGANPLLIGEPRVGKTAIVYGLAEKIYDGDVHESLKGTMVVQLHMDRLVQVSKYKGDLEGRLNTIIDYCKKKKAIIIIDEFHTFMNIGIISDGTVAPSNLIKPYLESGEIRIIAITTLNEFKKYVERDQAICGRLKKVVVNAPSVDDTIKIVEQLRESYETFHKCYISNDLISSLVKLCERYVTSSNFPDKAIGVLDETLAVAKLNNRKTATLDDIKYVVSKTSGVNINSMSESELDTLINLEDKFSESLIGQKHAISIVCKAIRRGKSGICNPNKPVASFLFVGPTGVGKTELCKILSKNYGACNCDSLIKLDMSEYSEGHSVSKLFGSPPGYVGYDEGGGLTEKVKHNPYSVILFDEIEKAHQNVFDSLLQLLDEGVLTDSKGTKVNFRNCIIVMTSNAGYGLESYGKGPLGFNKSVNDLDSTEKELKVMEELGKTFKPEFLNRIDNVITFEKISKEQSKDIVKLMFTEINNRLSEKNLVIKYTTKVLDLIVETGYSEKYNARNLRRTFQNVIENQLSDLVLSGQATSGCTINIGVSNNKIKLSVA